MKNDHLDLVRITMLRHQKTSYPGGSAPQQPLPQDGYAGMQKSAEKTGCQPTPQGASQLTSLS
jgi:hypothetical protein